MRWTVPLQRATAFVSRGRTRKVFLGGGVGVLLAALGVYYVPVPFVDGFLAGQVTDRIGAQFACAGSTAAPPEVTLKGGGIVPQLLSHKLSEVELSVPDTTMGGVQHAAFTATLRGVSQSGSGARVDSMDAAIKIPFKGMPAPKTGPKPTLGRSADGGISVTVVPAPSQARDVVTTVFLKFALAGSSLTVTADRLLMFGHTVPGSRFASLSGGAHTSKLPALPAGLGYTSVTPKADGLHVRLDGSVTSALSTLPTSFAGRTVSYTSENGMLGISTAIKVPIPLIPIPGVPLTIFAAPHLNGSSLTLEPRVVRVLGSDRGPDDPIAKVVLGQINPAQLTRKLPALPNGVAYKAVSVSTAGVRVVVGGESVRPFSELPVPGAGPGTIFGAKDGMLTVTSKGAFANGPAVPVVLYGRPRIVGSSLDLAPETIQMLDTPFPAADVLKEFKIQSTSFPLQPLPAHLAYTGVDVLPDGLRITISGKNVTMAKGMMGGQEC